MAKKRGKNEIKTEQVTTESLIKQIEGYEKSIKICREPLIKTFDDLNEIEEHWLNDENAMYKMPDISEGDKLSFAKKGIPESFCSHLNDLYECQIKDGSVNLDDPFTKVTGFYHLMFRASISPAKHFLESLVNTSKTEEVENNQINKRNSPKEEPPFENKNNVSDTEDIHAIFSKIKEALQNTPKNKNKKAKQDVNALGKFFVKKTKKYLASAANVKKSQKFIIYSIMKILKSCRTENNNIPEKIIQKINEFENEYNNNKTMKENIFEITKNLDDANKHGSKEDHIEKLFNEINREYNTIKEINKSGSDDEKTRIQNILNNHDFEKKCQALQRIIVAEKPKSLLGDEKFLDIITLIDEIAKLKEEINKIQIEGIEPENKEIAAQLKDLQSKSMLKIEIYDISREYRNKKTKAEISALEEQFASVPKVEKKIKNSDIKLNKLLSNIHQQLLQNDKKLRLNKQEIKEEITFDNATQNQLYEAPESQIPHEKIPLSEILLAITHNNESVKKTTKITDPDIYSVQKSDSSEINKKIKSLRESHADFIYTEPSTNRTILIKDLRDVAENMLNPIDPNEAQIQALRYLNGMLLIGRNMPSDPNKQNQKAIDFWIKIKNTYTLYQNFLKNPRNSPSDLTHWLADQFAILLEKTLSIDSSKARKQVTMARDLGTLMEEHPDICTISKPKAGQMTIERSSTLKISSDYYEKQLPICNGPKPTKWFKNAKDIAGFKETQGTWLDHFFSVGSTDFQKIIEIGSPIPPSARWLPQPANNQIIDCYTADLSNENNGLTNAISTNFIRMGTVSAFDIKDVKLQEQLAIAQLREILSSERIQQSAEAYSKQYAALLPDNYQHQFFINYLHLLSPFKGEAFLYPLHKDNNAAFVEMAKKAFGEIAWPHAGKNIQYHFTHTNTPINSEAASLLQREFTEDKQTRQDKLAATKKLLDAIFQEKTVGFTFDHLDKNNLEENIKTLETKLADVGSELKAEIITRTRAAFYFNQMLTNPKSADYKNLAIPDRNLMQVALEHLCMGSQSLALVGCKSARDRTAFFAAAVKTMQENPKAMHDWPTLNEGILSSIKQGHHIRSMSHHVAVLKVKEVGKKHMEELRESSPEQAKALSALKKFSQKPSAYEGESPVPPVPTPTKSPLVKYGTFSDTPPSDKKSAHYEHKNYNPPSAKPCPASTPPTPNSATSELEALKALLTQFLADIMTFEITLAAVKSSFFKQFDKEAEEAEKKASSIPLNQKK